MKKYQYALFDLDGTLTDSANGIINSVSYALSKFGINTVDRSQLKCFIGPPLIDSFESFCGFSHDKAAKAVEYYREYFKDTGIFENSLYQGIPELLKTLYDEGITLIIATSKPEIFAKRIAAHFDIEKYFSSIIGATMDGTLSAKEDIISHVLKTQGIVDKSSAIMIGDRHHDIEGAVTNGIASIGVLYGYGSLDELVSSGATYTVDNPNSIKNILIS